MAAESFRVAVIPGDGIGVNVTEAALAAVEAARQRVGGFALSLQHLDAGAGYFRETGLDIVPQGEQAAGAADAILLGAIGLPAVRHPDGTEISPHLRLRERFELYAGVRPVKAYPNIPQRLADPRAAKIDLVVLRESTEGLFYSAAAISAPRSSATGKCATRCASPARLASGCTTSPSAWPASARGAGGAGW